MKYDSWEDMIDAQAKAFCALCAQDERLNELAEKADNGYDNMSRAEQEELHGLWEKVYNNPFFANRCAQERESMEG